MAEKKLRKASIDEIAEVLESESKESEKAEKRTSKSKKVSNEDLLAAMTEQIGVLRVDLEENLRWSLQKDLKKYATAEVQKANRRRRWSNLFHDLVILVSVGVAAYFGWCLYDAKYFDFMKSDCERAGNCQSEQSPAGSGQTTQTAGPVKDETWYLANYSYLLDQIQTRPNADNITAYYLYADDHKPSEIPNEYLLSMAYNQVKDSAGAAVVGGGAADGGVVSGGVTGGDTMGAQGAMDAAGVLGEKVQISAQDMRQAFEETFGQSVQFVPGSFRNGCLEFDYDSGTEVFSAKNSLCVMNQKRNITERIERIYEEGEVIYVLTNAGVYDKTARSFYNFDNLFRAVVTDTQLDEFDKHKGSLNRYQYQFKKDGENYILGSIVKLR